MEADQGGLIEIRRPYYTVAGRRYLEDLFESFGEYVDGLKFAGGSFALMPRRALTGLIELCHAHDVKVSTGGFVEFVLTQGEAAVDRHLKECAAVGFDIVEISTGFVTLPVDDVVRLTERVRRGSLLAKPEGGIQFGAGGATSTDQLEAEGTSDPGRGIEIARRCLDAGAAMVMIGYIRSHGPEVNLFLDHSQIVQLECLRSGIWGTAGL